MSLPEVRLTRERIFIREVYNCANCPSTYPKCGSKKQQTEGICRRCQELRGCIKTTKNKPKAFHSSKESQLPPKGVNLSDCGSDNKEETKINE